MDKNSLIILLGAIIAVNFILLIILGRSNKKTPKLKKENKAAAGNEAFAYENEGKTEFLGKPKKMPVSQVKQQSVSQKEFEEKVDFDKIPALSNEVKQSLFDGTAVKTGKQQGVVETVLDLPEPELKAYRLAYMDEGKAKIYDMKYREVVIGRDPEQVNLLISSDVRVSRKHARLFVEDDKIFVEDLKSSNGTYVKGKRIDAVSEIQDGRFRVGNTDIAIDEVK